MEYTYGYSVLCFINKVYDSGQIFIGQTQNGSLNEHSKKCGHENKVESQRENVIF